MSYEYLASSSVFFTYPCISKLEFIGQFPLLSAMDPWNKKQATFFIYLFHILFLLDGMEANFIIPLHKKHRGYVGYWNLMISN